MYANGMEERINSEPVLTGIKKSHEPSFVGKSRCRRLNQKERTAIIFDQKHEDTKNFFVADHWTRIMLQNYGDTKLTDDSLLNFKKYRKPAPRKSTNFAKSKKPLEEPLDPKYYPVISQMQESPYLTEKDHKNLEMIKAACSTPDDIFNSTYKHLLSFQADYKSKPDQYKVDPIDIELSRNIPKQTLQHRLANPHFNAVEAPILKNNKYHIGTEKFIFSDNFKVKVIPHCVTLENPPTYPPTSSSSSSGDNKRSKVRALKNAVSRSREGLVTTSSSGNNNEATAATAATNNDSKDIADGHAVDDFPYDAFADAELLEMLQTEDNHKAVASSNNNAADLTSAAATANGDNDHSVDHTNGGEMLWDGAIIEPHNNPTTTATAAAATATATTTAVNKEVEVTSGDIVNCLVGMMTAELSEKQHRHRMSQQQLFQETLLSNKAAAEEEFRSSFKPINSSRRPQSASAVLLSHNRNSTTTAMDVNKSNSSSNVSRQARPQSAGRFGGITRAALVTEPLLLSSVRPHSAGEISRRLQQQARAVNTSQGGEYLISSRRHSGRLLLNRSLPTKEWRDVLNHF